MATIKSSNFATKTQHPEWPDYKAKRDAIIVDGIKLQKMESGAKRRFEFTLSQTPSSRDEYFVEFNFDGAYMMKGHSAGPRDIPVMGRRDLTQLTKQALASSHPPGPLITLPQTVRCEFDHSLSYFKPACPDFVVLHKKAIEDRAGNNLRVDYYTIEACVWRRNIDTEVTVELWSSSTRHNLLV